MRLDDFAKDIKRTDDHDLAASTAEMQNHRTNKAVENIAAIGDAMRAEEDHLFAERTETADRTQQLASIVTVVGSGLVIALAAISIFLVRRSARARDSAESQ